MRFQVTKCAASDELMTSAAEMRAAYSCASRWNCRSAPVRSMHPQTKEKSGRTLFRDIKTMKDDPAAVEQKSEEIKARYMKLFKV